MIEALLVVLIAFTALFYFMKQVGKKVDAINQYQLDLYKKEYAVLLKSVREDKQNMRELSKQVSSLEKELNILKNTKEKANIFSFNNKK
tara:strand:+ start:118 stop:384 length:267 start_codon:yes stop_codon:yes gene_type:complete